MELEGFKSAWQRRPLESDRLAPRGRLSRSVQFLRTSAAHDLQRSEELTRLIFSFLFAFLAVAAPLVVMPPGAGRIVAWLFAAALLADGIAGIALLIRRLRQPATTTLLEFISTEHGLIERRLQLERYAQGVMLILAAVALALQVFGPRPVNFNDDVLRMGFVTAFLAVAWFRGKSRSRSTAISQELESYLKDLRTAD